MSCTYVDVFYMHVHMQIEHGYFVCMCRRRMHFICMYVCRHVSILYVIHMSMLYIHMYVDVLFIYTHI